MEPFTARPARGRRTRLIIGTALAVAVAGGGVASASLVVGRTARTGSALSRPATVATAQRDAPAVAAPHARRTDGGVAVAAPPGSAPAAAPTPRTLLFVHREVRPGDEGADVIAVQERLRQLRYDPGEVDGRYGLETLYAVWAFQKIHGFRPDGIVDRDLWRLMVHALPPDPVVPDGAPDRVEVDLERQLLLLWRDDDIRLITHVSTGNEERFCANGRCRFAVTPKGDFASTWRHAGWRTSELGELYNPVYFNGGIAIHGSPSVPTEPASHGCVRIPMHIAEYLPDLVDRGLPVLVR